MYLGPPIDDDATFAILPSTLRRFLEQCNGYVAYHGGLHLRGACLEPTWHSLRYWWFGAGALHTLFPTIDPDDIPFAQDALGDQYLLRGDIVHRLSAEEGIVSSLNIDLWAFDEAVRRDPVDYLSLGPLQAFRAEGGVLEPGQLLSVTPPFVFKQSADGVVYRAVQAEDRIRFLAELARQIADVPDGASITLEVKNLPPRDLPS